MNSVIDILPSAANLFPVGVSASLSLQLSTIRDVMFWFLLWKLWAIVFCYIWFFFCCSVMDARILLPSLSFFSMTCYLYNFTCSFKWCLVLQLYKRRGHYIQINFLLSDWISREVLTTSYIFDLFLTIWALSG
jgi:hypothetical protein